MDMGRPALYSAILHVAIFVIVWFGVPQLFRPEIAPEQPLVVEVLPISAVTNVKPQPDPVRPQPEAKPEPPKPEPPKPPPPPPPAPVQAPAPTPAPAPPKVEAAVPAPPPPKPEPPKPEPPKQVAALPRPPAPKPPPKQDFDLDAVLRDLTRTRPRPSSVQEPERPKAQPQQAAAPRAQNTPFNPALPLSVSEQDAIRAHVERFWNPPVGARDAHDLVVEVRVVLEPDGTVRDAEIVDRSRAAGDEFYRAAAESARRAVLRASPLPVPRDKYETYRNLTLVFSPREMLGIRG
jgi:outer membrane biosynthesis protein TonB